MPCFATLNLNHSLDRWLQRRRLVIEQLLALSPDVLALQEVARPIRQAQWIRNQLNARAGDQYPPYQLVQGRRRGGISTLLGGEALLSRLPILSHDVLGLGFGRIALRANIELPSGETVDVVTTHLYAKAAPLRVRDEQVMRMMGWLDSPSAVVHRVLLGCFREPAQEPAIRRIKTFFGFRSAYEMVHGREPYATWPTALNTHQQTVGVCHDYIFVSPQIKDVYEAGLFCTNSAENDPTLLPSDHVGVFARLTV